MTANDMERMLEQVASMRDQLTASEVVGTSRDGSVAVTMTANTEFRAVRVDPEFLEHAGHEEVESVFLEALRDTGAQLHELTERRMADVTAALGQLRF